MLLTPVKEKVFELEIDSAALPAFKEKQLVVNAIRKKIKYWFVILLMSKSMALYIALLHWKMPIYFLPKSNRV